MKYRLSALILPIVYGVHGTYRVYVAVRGLRVSPAESWEKYGGTSNPDYPQNPFRMEWQQDARGRSLYAFGYVISNEWYSQEFER